MIKQLDFKKEYRKLTKKRQFFKKNRLFFALLIPAVVIISAIIFSFAKYTTSSTYNVANLVVGTFTQKTYPITLNAMGGSVNPTTIQVTSEGSYGTLPTPTKTGYVFIGWYTAASGGAQVTSSTIYHKSAGAITIYAHWTVKTLTVNFIYGGQVNTQYFTYGVAGQSFANTGFSRSGYTLDAWSDTDGGSAVYYVYSGVADSWIDSCYPTKNLYAHWKSNAVYIFNAGSYQSSAGGISMSQGYNWASSFSTTSTVNYYRQREPGYYGATIMRTAGVVDLSPYTTATIVYSGSLPYSDAGIYGSMMFGFAQSPTITYNSNDQFSNGFQSSTAVSNGNPWSGGNVGGTIYLNVANLYGNYYFFIGVMNYSEASSMTVSSILLS